MLALIALGLPALAVAPDPDLALGFEPTRIHRFHVERQHALRHGPSWQAFLDGDGAGWQARFDERTGLALSAWGPPIALGQLEDAVQVEAAVRDFLQRNPGLLGVPVDQLRVRTIARDRRASMADLDAWTVQVQQVLPTPAGLDLADPYLGGHLALSDTDLLDPLGLGGGLVDHAPDFAPQLDATGVAVWGGTVQLRIVAGRLVHLANRTVPGLEDALAVPALSAETAVEVAIEAGPAAKAEHDLRGARLVVLPVEAWGLDSDAPAGLTGEGLHGLLAYEVWTRTTEPVGAWVSWVDAGTGELLGVRNDVRNITGTLTAMHDTRTVDGNMSESPLVELRLDGEDGESTYTDAVTGAWTLAGSDEAEATLTGTWVSVNNSSGDEAEASFSGDFTWTTDDATQAELDSYVFLNQVIDWKGIYAPEVSTGGRLRSNVNINSSCNAYFDGSVNFYQSGGSCNNTGRIADVNYHEWGHGFHYYSLESGTYDGSLGEGAADVVSILNTGDYKIGPYFYTNGSPVREVSTDKVYPDDYTNSSNAIHSNGLIFGGSMWDLWGLLQAELGEEDAYEEMADIFTGLLKYGPGVADSYDAAVLADDDNGNLADGTPNICPIIQAFGPHGLGPLAGMGDVITLSHLPLGTQSPALSEYPIEVDVLNAAPDCFDFDAATATLYYSTDGGETWQEIALDPTPELLSGAIPAQPPGTIVHYYVQATDGSTEASAPDGGFIAPYTFVVGELVEIYCEDFEADDGGYTHDLLEGTEQEGADDWIWASPRGYADDPEFAASGDYIWGNDLGGGNYNGEYQPDKHNRLRSVPIDVSGHDSVVLIYKRWLAVEDGYWDHAELVRIFGEDDDSTELLWTNYDSPGGSSTDHSDHHIDKQWVDHAVEIDVSDGGPLQLGWDIISDAGLEFGGWNIDDVCVYAWADGSSHPSDGGAGDGGSEDGGTEGDAGAEFDGGTEDDGDGWTVKPSGCACSAGPVDGRGAVGLVGVLLGLVGLRRRRR